VVVIWGDEIGQANRSCYSTGLMGYRTLNIDRIAREEMIFTDCYGQQSCRGGPAAFTKGQDAIRTRLTKVGLPGAKPGLLARDPTPTELLKPYGYATAQFGKNHLDNSKDE
jgi:arylsulfatase A-like enzyme